MGFISNVAGTLSDSIKSELDDQFLETFKTDSLGQTILVKHAQRIDCKGFNQGNSEIISAGSKIIVPEGTYALMIDNGNIVDSVIVPGTYTWNNSSSHSILSGGFKGVVDDVFNRFKFAGEVVKVQRIFYVNGLEIMNQTSNKYLEVPYPDPIYGTLYFKFRITFSFRIVEPVRFFMCTGKATSVLEFMGSPACPRQPVLEVMDHMEQALNICATRDKLPFPQLLAYKSKLKNAINETVSRLWYEQRGMVIESIALTDLTLSESSRNRVEQFDSAKIFSKDPAALKALAVLGFVKAMNTAAANPSGAAAAVGVAGVGMSAASIPVPKTCPFCGTQLPSKETLRRCPACSADI